MSDTQMPADSEDVQDAGATGDAAAQPEVQVDKTNAHWYVIHTYSGYEDRVATNLKQRIDTMDMAEKIFQVLVPTKKTIELKDGQKKEAKKKIFPGYVLVQMILDDDSWYVVRNTPNVTGFVGIGSKPTPLGDTEVNKILKTMGKEAPAFKIDFAVGESVEILSGPFAKFVGKVSEIDEDRGKVTVLVSVFDRETPMELNFTQVKRAV
ncbi:MAG TPA: transcription termination/antitermination protein NusG [bacterium]|nr:transcription termination/antitermination protein NusG [bacterium]